MSQEEKDANWLAVNKHMRAQPAIDLLVQKVTNMCNFVITYVADGKLDSFLPVESRNALVARLTKIRDEIQTTPVPFVQAVHMIGGQFFDHKKKEMDFEAFKQSLPMIKEFVSKIPDADPGLLAIDPEKTPQDLADKIKAYVNCFCNILFVKEKK